MMKLGLLCGLVCLLLVPVCAGADDIDPSESLAKAESEFQLQQYPTVVRLLRAVLYPDPKLELADDQHRARELLAASYWFLKDLDKSREEFQYLLLKRPAFELDTFVYPLEIRNFLAQLRRNLVRQGLIPSLEEINKPKEEPKPPSVMRVTQIVQQNSRATAFMPFGVAQFEYGEDAWGAFFATSQGLAALGNIGTYVALWTLQDQEVNDDRTAALQTALIATGASLIALYLWGAIDGNIRHEPFRVVNITTEELDPKEAAQFRTPQPQLTQPGQTRPDVPTPVAPGGSPR